MYAVIDIGSNTIRLVIYKIENGKIISLLNKKYSAGLAGYIDENNKMTDAGILRAIEVLNEFREITDNMNIGEVFPFATAAMRNIDNSLEVLKMIEQGCGLNIEVLSGREEAVFDYYGAILGLNIKDGLLIDVGGGSTELVFCKEGEVEVTTSLPIGSLNLYTRFVEEIVPEPEELAKIQKHIELGLNSIKLPDIDICKKLMCGVGGTARAALSLLKYMGAIDKNQEKFDSFKYADLLQMYTTDTRRFVRQLLKTSPDRIHTFLPGLVILNTVVKRYGCQKVVTSLYGVREGYLYYMLQKRGEL